MRQTTVKLEEKKMSEEKLYVVKNDKGEWLSFDSSHESVWYTNNPTFFNDKNYAEAQAGSYGHVIELVEPEKVVLTKEQAEIVEGARDFDYPASHISNNSCEDEELLMKAYVNGYTMEKEKKYKKYNVKVPKNWSGDNKHYWSKEQDGSLTWACLINKDYMIPTYQFTLTEIQHYGLQDCEREEVKQDEN